MRQTDEVNATNVCEMKILHALTLAVSRQTQSNFIAVSHQHIFKFTSFGIVDDTKWKQRNETSNNNNNNNFFKEKKNTEIDDELHTNLYDMLILSSQALSLSQTNNKDLN